MDRLRDLFDSVAVDGIATAQRIKDKVSMSGIMVDDFRLSKAMARLAELGDDPVTFESFQAVVACELLMLNRVFTNQRSAWLVSMG